MNMINGPNDDDNVMMRSRGETEKRDETKETRDREERGRGAALG